MKMLSSETSLLPLTLSVAMSQTRSSQSLSFRLALDPVVLFTNIFDIAGRHGDEAQPRQPRSLQGGQRCADALLAPQLRPQAWLPGARSDPRQVSN